MRNYYPCAPGFPCDHRVAWGDYLGDPPLALAFLDRVVDGAIVIKIDGKSYRAHRAGTKKNTATK